MSIMFTIRMHPGSKMEILTIFSAEGRVLLSVAFDRNLVISFQDGITPIRASRFSVTGNEIQTFKLGPAIDDNE